MYRSNVSPTSTRLALSEATTLAHALVQSVARNRNIRTLSIKGPVANSYGLRPHRVSADADLIVEPRSLSELVDELSSLGWRPRVTSQAPDIIPLHSVTLVNPRWPCDLDIHWYFPGFLSSPESAFDSLWQTRVEVAIGATACFIPSAAGAALIGILHSYRIHDSRRETERAHLRALIDNDYLSRDKDALISLAIETGAIESAREFLSTTSIVLPECPTVAPAGLKEWQLEAAFGGSGTMAWLVSINRAPLRGKPTLIRQALFPSVDSMRADHPEMGEKRWSYFRGIGVRLWSRLRELPSRLAALRVRR